MVSEEKKGTLQDVANQKGVVCRAQGWKMHLCAAQLMQLVRETLLPFYNDLCIESTVTQCGQLLSTMERT
jgi:hypothetical protein